MYLAFATASCGLLVAWAVVHLLSATRWKMLYRLLLVAAVFSISLLPFKGLLLAQYVRGFVGDLSISTICLLVWGMGCFLWAHHPAENIRQQKPVYGFLAAAGFCLYPSSLGLVDFDLYALGYAPRTLGLILLALALYSGWKKYTLALTLLCAVVFAYGIGFLPSHNLWNYLIDPLVFLYATGWWIFHGLHSFFRSQTLCKTYGNQN